MSNPRVRRIERSPMELARSWIESLFCQELRFYIMGARRPKCLHYDSSEWRLGETRLLYGRFGSSMKKFSIRNVVTKQRHAEIEIFSQTALVPKLITLSGAWWCNRADWALNSTNLDRVEVEVEEYYLNAHAFINVPTVLPVALPLRMNWICNNYWSTYLSRTGHARQMFNYRRWTCETYCSVPPRETYLTCKRNSISSHESRPLGASKASLHWRSSS
jgi:hypothetical protein